MIFSAEVRWLFDEEVREDFRILEAANFAHATKRIEDCYGEDLLSVNLSFLSDGEFLLMKKDAFESAINGVEQY